MNVNRMKRVAILVTIVLVSMLPCAQAGRTIYGGQEKPAQDALYPYNAPEGSCLIDLSGNVYADDGYLSIYTLVSDSGERLFSATKAEGEDMRCYLLDEKGQRLTDGACFWLAPNGEHIEFQSTNGLMGLYGWHGETLVEPTYQSLIPTGEGSYIGLMDDSWAIQRAEADLIRPGVSVAKITLGGGDVNELDDFIDGLAAAGVNDGGRELIGFIDTTGSWEIPPIYDYTYGFIGNYAIVSMDGRIGMIDREGDTALPFEYDSINPVFDERKRALSAQRGTDITVLDAETLKPLFVVGDADYGWIDQNAALVVRGASVDQTRAYSLDGELICVIRDDDKDFSIINQNRYCVRNYDDYTYELRDFQGNTVMSGVGMLRAVTGADGAYALELTLFDVIDYGDGYTGPDWNRMRYGLYDLDGNELLEPKYDYIVQVCEGYYSVRRGQWHGVVDSTGGWVLKRSNYMTLMD